MPLVKVEMSWMSMPSSRTGMVPDADSVPALVMPPAKVEIFCTSMAELKATILPAPATLMSPEKTMLPPTKMPSSSRVDIVPLSTMPPEKLATFSTPTPLSPPETVPTLVMPPANVATWSARMPTLFAATRPRLTMPPPALLRPKVTTLLAAMPTSPAEIVPVLPMAPAKVARTTVRTDPGALTTSEDAVAARRDRAGVADAAGEGRQRNSSAGAGDAADEDAGAARDFAGIVNAARRTPTT